MKAATRIPSPGPRADFPAAWAELTGYVQAAVDDGGTINPAGMLAYMAELKRAALAPVREWTDPAGVPPVKPQQRGGRS